MIKDYNPTGVKETDVTDSYGNKGYNVFFEGEDKPVFLKAKNAPEVGKVEYGEITDEAKKSGNGTYRKFTRKTKDEGAHTQESVTANGKEYPVPSGQSTYQPKDSEGMAWGNALTNATTLVGQGGTPEEVIKVAEMFFNHRLGLQQTPEIDDKISDEPLPEPQGEVTEDVDEIDLNDIPF